MSGAISGGQGLRLSLPHLLQVQVPLVCHLPTGQEIPGTVVDRFLAGLPH